MMGCEGDMEVEGGVRENAQLVVYYKCQVAGKVYIFIFNNF